MLRILYKFFGLVIIIINVNVSCSQKCDYFKTVRLEVRDKNGQNSRNRVANGCLDGKGYNDKQSYIYIRKQSLQVLGKDAVKNMVHLKGIVIDECDLKEVNPFSFANVPKLESIQISNCRLEKIWKDVFTSLSSLRELEIRVNQVNFIDNEAFAGLTNLDTVYIIDNQVEYWNKEWFKNCAALRRLHFGKNKIRKLPTDAFTGLTALEMISFAYNEIDEIQPEAFKGLNNLEYLTLEYNKLKVLNGNIFPSKIVIIHFNVRGNYLNFLPNDLLRKVSLTQMELGYNPFSCPCMNEMNNWFYSNNVKVWHDYGCDSISIPICAFPKTSSQTCLEIPDDELTTRYLGIVRNLSSLVQNQCQGLTELWNRS